ncbi:MAG: choice-of-anchor Q domain-containing protein [bacterium]
MRVENPGNLDLRDSIIKNGCADSSGGVDAKIGGGILNFNANLEISNSIFLENAAEFRGGAVDTTFGISTVENSYFQDNFTNFGGGAFSNFTSTTNISESTFYRNTAGSRAGAIFNIDGTGQVQQSTLILNSNTFSLNNSNDDGGALYNENAEIVGSFNNTLASNIATNFGGAIYNTSTGAVDISAFLFSQNGGGVTECFNNGGSFVSNEGLTDNNAGGCANNESSNINLLPLSDNGCTTPLADGTCIKTHGLDVGSFAINPAVHFLGTDQRGFSIVGRHDVGAYEFLTGGQQCTQLGLGVSITPNGFSASVATDFELNQAINCANLDSTDTDTIILTENITLDKLYVANDGKGATGTVLISTPMIIDGNNHKLQRNLNFSCDIDNTELNTEFRLMKVTKTGDLDLRNISLENGCADSSGPLSRGGGILNNGLLAITRSTIINNRADFGAGISNSIVSGGAVPNISSLDSVIISDNIAGFKGGGIENTLATITLIKNSIIKNNQALSGTNGNGGGIFNDSNSSIDTISNTSIVNNTAGFDGAGIFNDFTIASLFDTTFSGNTAANFGGGIRNQGGINLISNSTFSSNRANKGGAVYTSGNITEIQHSTFHKNQADSIGGALLSSGGISEVNNSLFVQNLGTRQDCGTENSGDINGSNNLSNTSGSNNNCDATIAGNLDSSTVGELADNGCHGNSLADGGCNKTHALSSSSQAVNFIANTSLLLDQRRFSVEDGQRDAGAYEFIPPSALCSQAGINTNAAFTATPDITSDLTLAINCANANNATTDTIIFGADILLTQAFENIDTGIFNDIASKGRTGTPAITSPLIINGMGFSLMRDTDLTCGSLSSNSPEDPNRFRLLRIANTGSLELSNISLVNGCVSQNSQVHKFYGGGIYNQGDLSVTDSVFSNNSAATGAGIYNYHVSILFG